MAASGTDQWLINYPKGLVVSGEFAYAYVNRNYKADGSTPGFIYCAGKSAGGPNIVGAGFAMELAKRGYPVLCGDIGDTPTAAGKTDGPGVWGKDATLALITTYKAFLQGTLGAKAGPIGLLYGSHGCIAAYAYAKANPSSVSLIAGCIGTADVEDIRANNRNSYQASIEAAYTNNAGWQTARATHNPVEVAGSLTIPQLDYYSTDDPICVASTHAALLTAAGSNLTQRSLGAVGHSFVGVNGRTATYTQAFADWVEARLS